MLTKKQLSQAVQTYARKHGFSTSTVRATTDLRQKAIEAYKARQDRQTTVAQLTTPYKARILEWMKDFADGVTTEELKAAFPRASIREMEKVNQTICYSDNKWHLASK